MHTVRVSQRFWWKNNTVVSCLRPGRNPIGGSSAAPPQASAAAISTLPLYSAALSRTSTRRSEVGDSSMARRRHSQIDRLELSPRLWARCSGEVRDIARRRRHGPAGAVPREHAAGPVATGTPWDSRWGFARRRCSSMPEGEFHSVADEELEGIHDAVEVALEEGFDEDFDCNMSQGVLNLIVGDRGTWVLNKQSPNRQIWWSSPISGPMRFEYDRDSRHWMNTRDGTTELRSLLTAEMKDKCGVDLGTAFD